MREKRGFVNFLFPLECGLLTANIASVCGQSAKKTLRFRVQGNSLQVAKLGLRSEISLLGSV